MPRTTLRLLCALGLALGAAGPAMADQGDDPPGPVENGEQGQTTLDDLSRDEVRQLQQALQERGLYPGEIDGLVGPLTYAAYGAFKQDQGGTIDTSIDMETASALGMDVADVQPVRGGPEEEQELQQQQEQQPVDPDQTDDVESIEDDIRNWTE